MDAEAGQWGEWLIVLIALRSRVRTVIYLEFNTPSCCKTSTYVNLVLRGEMRTHGRPPVGRWRRPGAG